MKQFIFSLMALAIIASPALAESQLDEDRTVIHLTEQASKKVEQDRLRATLRVEIIGQDTSLIQKDINKAMKDAVDLANGSKSIKAITGVYNVHRHYDRETKKEDKWRGYQSITLDSDDPTHLLKLVGMLQDNGFIMDGLSYYLSEEKAASFRDELISEALRRVQLQARSVASQLGKKDVHLAKIVVGDDFGSEPPRPMPRMFQTEMAMMKSAPTPVATSTEETVRINVSVTVWITD
jgi:predicted secreted protein